jgi:F-type H+-transporting ATPase subunit b
MKKSVILTACAQMLLVAPLLAQEHEAAEGGASGPLVVNGGLMIWTVVVFVLLLIMLRKFAWPQILGAVRAREAALEAQIAEAEKNRAESAALLEQHKKLIADGRAQAQGLLTEAKAIAEKERALALEKTREEQEELLARARRDIQAERDRAVLELRQEAVDLSLAAASKLIGQRLTADSDRKLVEGYLSSLETK